MTNIEKIKVKNLDSVDFCTISLTSSDVCMMTASGTPKPRELTEKEIDKFSLRHHNKEKPVMEPVFEHTGSVWCASDNGKLPTYRLYNCGTNCLKVLKYTPDRDVWEEVKLEDISTLYGFVWNMCLELENPTSIDITTLISGGNYHDLLDPEEVEKWKYTIK